MSKTTTAKTTTAKRGRVAMTPEQKALAKQTKACATLLRKLSKFDANIFANPKVWEGVPPKHVMEIEKITHHIRTTVLAAQREVLLAQLQALNETIASEIIGKEQTASEAPASAPAVVE